MSEFKHTPGPWEIVDNMRDPDGFAIYAPNEDYQLDRIGRGLNKFNAHLMAASPELLEALVDLYKSIDGCCDLTPEVMAKARAAIAKATGVKE